jgi:protein TonB
VILSARAQRGGRLRALAGAAALALLAGALAGCGEEPPKPKRMQTVKLLPDTPPPPPPPPPRPEEKRPEPKKDETPPPTPQQQPEQAQALKTDEAAGTGPGSGLVAGAVTQDYTDQKIGSSAAPPVAATVGVNRLAANAFAGNVTRALNDYLARERSLKERDYRVPVNLWLQADGRVQRVELAGSTGDGAVDDALRAALERFPGAGLPLPDRLPQPLRVQVSNRMIG